MGGCVGPEREYFSSGWCTGPERPTWLLTLLLSLLLLLSTEYFMPANLPPLLSQVMQLGTSCGLPIASWECLQSTNALASLRALLVLVAPLVFCPATSVGRVCSKMSFSMLYTFVTSGSCHTGGMSVPMLGIPTLATGFLLLKRLGQSTGLNERIMVVLTQGLYELVCATGIHGRSFHGL